MADEVVNDWPDRYLAKVGDELGPRDAVCVLTHDHKFDVPAIVGRGADRRRLPRRDGLAAHARRARRAAARGRASTDDELARVHGADRARHRRPHARRRPRSRSAPRSSRCAPAAGVASLRDTSGPDPLTASTHDRGGSRGPRHRRASGRRSPRRRKGSASRPPRRSRAEGVHVAICGRRPRRDRRGGRAHRCATRCRSSPTSRRADGAAGFVRDARDALGGIDILVAQRGRSAAGRLRAARPSTSTATRSSSTASRRSRCVTRRCPRCARSGGGGWSRSRRSRCASRSPDLILSNTARAGLTGFLKTLAREVAADGVTVNSLLPGLHETERIRRCTAAARSTTAAARSRPATIGEPDDFGADRRVPVLGAGPLRHRHRDPGRRRRLRRAALSTRSPRHPTASRPGREPILAVPAYSVLSRELDDATAEDPSCLVPETTPS